VFYLFERIYNEERREVITPDELETTVLKQISSTTLLETDHRDNSGNPGNFIFKPVVYEQDGMRVHTRCMVMLSFLMMTCFFDAVSLSSMVVAQWHDAQVGNGHETAGGIFTMISLMACSAVSSLTIIFGLFDCGLERRHKTFAKRLSLAGCIWCVILHNVYNTFIYKDNVMQAGDAGSQMLLLVSISNGFSGSISALLSLVAAVSRFWLPESKLEGNFERRALVSRDSIASRAKPLLAHASGAGEAKAFPDMPVLQVREQELRTTNLYQGSDPVPNYTRIQL